MAKEPGAAAHPEVDLTRAHDPDGETCWYVAIGSMMNPTSMKLRNLHPVESYPCKVEGFELHFKLGGMASAEKNPGGHLHGVLHRMTLKDMAQLDEIERSYTKHVTPAHVYHPKDFVKEAFIYHMEVDQFKNMRVKPPTERYLDIMCLGCKHHGVDQAWHDWLLSHENTPRKKMDEFHRVGAAPDRVFTFDEIFEGTGDDGKPLLMAISDKVLKYIGDVEEGAYQFYKQRAGRDVTLGFARALYEPKFKVAQAYCDLSEEHKAFIEDLLINFADGHWEERWEVVGSIDSEALTAEMVRRFGDNFFAKKQ